MPLLIFENTRAVIRAEAALVERGVSVAVVPLPDARCGMGLRVADGELERAEVILTGAHIIFRYESKSWVRHKIDSL